MKKNIFTILSLFLTVNAFTQKEIVVKTIQVFPYQHLNNVTGTLQEMNSWNQSQWNDLLSLLNDDSLRVKASYALDAYVHHISGDKNISVQAASHLSDGLKHTASYSAKELLIKELGLLGEDKAVKPLSKWLNEEKLSDNAARAIATIGTPKALSVLKKSLKKKPGNPYLIAAIKHFNDTLPFIKQQSKAVVVKNNPVQTLLDLQDQMEKSSNPVFKKRILANAALIPGFSSFMFASQYLNDTELNKEAALIIARLALNDKNIRGPIVREALEKAIPLIKGEDSTVLVNKLNKHLKAMPYENGFKALFNGKDLSGWKALVGNPITRAKMSEKALADTQITVNEKTKGDWIAKDGLLIFTGHGNNLATNEKYGDIEMYVDWKITANGDAGIYLRGTPQVQIWDTSRRKVGAEVGSGGLYNNKIQPSKPLVVADNKIGEWNRFHIIMKGERVTVYLNGQLVTDNVILENYWDRSLPIFAREQIELQAHGTYVAYRNIYLRELPSEEPVTLSEEEKKEGFKILYDGTDLDQWTGNKSGYLSEEGAIVVHPEAGGGNLYTMEEYADFIYRFEFQLTPGANNGIGIRAPLSGNAAYQGMEIQVLDNEHPIYKDLQVYQYHGSVYGVIPAKRGFLKPTGEWNKEEVIAKGNKIKVILNGETILDGDLKEAAQNGTIDHKEHPGLFNPSGHIGFLGHGDVVRFRNIRVKRL